MPPVSVFVVLSVAIAFAAMIAAVLMGRELYRTTRKLSAQVKHTNQRLRPLTDELQSEIAVTSLEIEGLSRQVQQLSAERSARAKTRTRTKRKGKGSKPGSKR